MIALAFGVILGTSELAIWNGFTPGARFFPLLVGGLGLLLAALLLWQQWRGTDPGEMEDIDRPALLRVGLTIAALVAFAFGAPKIGMVPMLAAFSLFMLQVILRQRLLPSLVTALVIAGGIHLIFARSLNVPLPAPFGL